MPRSKITPTILALVLALALPRLCGARDELARNPTWRPLTAAEVRGRVFAWLDRQKLDPSVQRQARSLWPEFQAPGADMLDRLGATVALVDARARPLLDFARTSTVDTRRPAVEWLRDPGLAPLVRNNLRLLLARRLVQLQYFDEALDQLAGLQTEDVVDPAALLFYGGVAHLRLLHSDQGLTAIDRLLERPAEIPPRFAALAHLMQGDLRQLAQLKEESLDHISRRMGDIERRLERGRSGEKVRDVEDGVVKSLDKLIKRLEDQMAASSSESLQSSAPAQDSLPAGGKGPGLVTKKHLGKNNAWGDLPPKERQEAMQDIGRDFPANYRDVIEEYFREITDTKPEK